MMKKDQFVYVTYIRTTPEKLWKALTEPEFTRQFWCNTAQESEWKPGASWRIKAPSDLITESGGSPRNRTASPACVEMAQ